MAQKPTHHIPDVSALTERQLDGLACVACGTSFGAGSRSVPAGEALGAQVFACLTCAAACPDCGTVEYEYLPNENDRARFDCSRHHEFPTAEPFTEAGRRADEEARQRADEQPVTGTIPGEWPNGEPPDVRDMARRRADLAQRADDLAAMLEAEADDVRDVDLGQAVRQAAEAHRAFADVCRNGDEEEFDRALREISDMIRRCLATVRRCDVE
ncbi:putative nucleic acid-binding Zn-ribbon protein [Actinomadura coerulea]|uniref:Putative nucleic acid-binding Zn-ribbon protein n=1 Tax=Actinomadura coerulea TaxID=46159 RepID=A0A7X0G3Y4_9ACTN|nr:hypothetical protein [Actinomadura coerulea]MBB6398916.1 putative nucleic acid-binding Zn-ribbon protein [Actinomadura coerulea]GGP98278.1 hypothetical protein GCM10010187_12360 [Actinomadura coerulea]